MLSPPQKYAAGGLLALSLNQVLINKTNPLSSISEDNSYGPDEITSRYVDRDLWLQHYSNILHLIFRLVTFTLHALYLTLLPSMPVMPFIVIYLLVTFFFTIRDNVLRFENNFNFLFYV